MKTARFLAILLAMSMVLASVGCASQPTATAVVNPTAQPAAATVAVATAQPTQPQPTQPQPTSAPQEKVKLVVWTNMTAEAQTKVLTKQFNEVAKELGIEVEMQTVAFKDMYTKLATAVQSGNVPDIMQTNFAGTAYLYSQGMLEPMDDVIDTVGRADFIPTYLRVLTAGGKTWGIPDWAMHTSVWYRKDLLADKGLKVPTNWQEFEAVAKALTLDTNKDGKTDIYGFAVPMNAVQVAPQTYYEFLYSAGVTTFDPKTGKYSFGQQKDMAVKTLDYLVNLYKTVSPPSSTEWSWNEYRNALVQGTVAMTLDMGAVIGLAQANNKDMVEKLGRFDFPGPDGTKSASFGSGYAFMATKQSSAAKTKVEKEFLKRLYTSERAAERALSRPMFAFPSMYSALKIYKLDKSVASFQAEITTITDAFEHSNWYWYGMEYEFNQMSSQIEATTFFGEAMQKAAMGSWTSKDAVDYIDQNLQDQIKIIEGK
jgi:ABC-type glycerol-3-phosphate transport system substrate-binding protein